jgi:hypothetical protein
MRHIGTIKDEHRIVCPADRLSFQCSNKLFDCHDTMPRKNPLPSSPRSRNLYKEAIYIFACPFPQGEVRAQSFVTCMLRHETDPESLALQLLLRVSLRYIIDSEDKE